MWDRPGMKLKGGGKWKLHGTAPPSRPLPPPPESQQPEAVAAWLEGFEQHGCALASASVLASLDDAERSAPAVRCRFVAAAAFGAAEQLAGSQDQSLRCQVRSSPA